MRDKWGLAFAAALLALLGTTVAAYWQGLSGPFLFDDTVNLEPLKLVGGVDDLNSFQQFVFGGQAGPLGRPLSLMSFLINDFAWPSDPFSFKYTNLLIHLLNGMLICMLALQLTRALKVPGRQAGLIAISTTAIWLLHPMHISTILFVIQRMTELMTLFVLAGLLAYVHGRRVAEEHPGRGYLWMSGGIGLGTLLAVLSKENGALLPVYALAIEWIILRHVYARPLPYWQGWSAVFFYLPVAGMAGYFITHTDQLLANYAQRDFTLMERLLTESRILLDYIKLLFIPRLSDIGVFHDDYVISRGLLSPPTTLLAVMAILGMIIGAFLLRHRAPVLSLAIAWFLIGHSIESTVLPLELYFEHRNYLASFGLFFVLAYYLWTTAPQGIKYLRAGIVLFVVLQASILWQNSNLWGNSLLMSQVWAEENPRSIRAQQFAALHWMRLRDYEMARKYLRQGLEFHPDNLGLHMELLQVDCLDNTMGRVDFDALIAELSDGSHDNASLDTLHKLVSLNYSNHCPELSAAQLHTIIDTLLHNPNFQDEVSLGNLYYFKGLLYEQHGRLQSAVEVMDRAYEQRPRVEFPLLQAKWSAAGGMFEQAHRYIEKAKSADQDNWLRSGLKHELIETLEKQIDRLQSQHATPPKPQAS